MITIINEWRRHYTAASVAVNYAKSIKFAATNSAAAAAAAAAASKK